MTSIMGRNIIMWYIKSGEQCRSFIDIKFFLIIRLHQRSYVGREVRRSNKSYFQFDCLVFRLMNLFMGGWPASVSGASIGWGGIQHNFQCQ